MKFRRPRHDGPITDPIFAELVDLLFSAGLPVVIIGVIVSSFGALITVESHDAFVGVLTAVAALVTVARLAIILAFRRRGSPAAEARRWERRYAAGSFVFATVLGIMGARAYRLDDPITHMLAGGMLFAYGAGLVTRVSVRPWICNGSLLLSSIPFVASIFTRADADIAYVGLGLLILFMLVGAFESVNHEFCTRVEMIATKKKFELLARTDSLTGLPNRLLLEERLAEEVSRAHARGRHLAVHFLDLDQFKAANDRHGHPIGDAILATVAKRLASLLREGDIASRVGGDEFVVVQSEMGFIGEADTLARRIVHTLSAPYAVHGREIVIGVSVGIAVAPRDGKNAEELIARADAALYAAKNRGRGQVAFADGNDHREFAF